MDLYPRLVATVMAQYGQIGPHPSVRYNVLHFLYENYQNVAPLQPPTPIDVIQEENNRHIAQPLIDLAGYINYNQNYDPNTVLSRMKNIGEWITNFVLPWRCLCCYNNGLPQTVEIVTNQHEIPWELAWVRNNFLARQVIHTRYPFTSRARTSSVGYSNVPRFVVLVGRTAGLPAAHEELNELRKLYWEKFHEEITVFKGEEVTTDLIRDLLAVTGGFEKPFDIIHFIGHGNAQQDRVWLELLRYPFLDNQVPQVVGGNPVVFLNACFSGTNMPAAYRYQADVLDSFGGRLLSGGASHFIGPLLPVPDITAKRFATLFYTHLFSGTPVGIAFFEAKKELCEADPLACMYVLYGGPAVRLVNNGNV